MAQKQKSSYFYSHPSSHLNCSSTAAGSCGRSKQQIESKGWLEYDMDIISDIACCSCNWHAAVLPSRASAGNDNHIRGEVGSQEDIQAV